ncbi:MAG: hypothetical protein OXI87_08585, partial [Albidovulum sp.]|nr:hypothetical protein [Albidovulum sp.]
PVLPSERQNPQAALQMVRVDRDLGVGQPRLQLAPPVPGVVRRLRDRAPRRVARILVAAIAPLPEGVRDRSRAGSPELELLAALQLPFPDLPLAKLQRSDQIQRLGGEPRLGMYSANFRNGNLWNQE